MHASDRQVFLGMWRPFASSFFVCVASFEHNSLALFATTPTCNNHFLFTSSTFVPFHSDSFFFLLLLCGAVHEFRWHCWCCVLCYRNANIVKHVIMVGVSEFWFYRSHFHSQFEIHRYNSSFSMTATPSLPLPPAGRFLTWFQSKLTLIFCFWFRSRFVASLTQLLIVTHNWHPQNQENSHFALFVIDRISRHGAQTFCHFIKV